MAYKKKKRNLFSRVIINEDNSMKIREGGKLYVQFRFSQEFFVIDRSNRYVLFPPPSRLKFQKTIPAIRTIFIEQIGQK